VCRTTHAHARAGDSRVDLSANIGGDDMTMKLFNAHSVDHSYISERVLVRDALRMLEEDRCVLNVRFAF
jgi:hypothetical protein